MKLLTFQARRFGWRPHEQSLEEGADPAGPESEVTDAVVVFFHAEAKDEDPEARKRAFKHTLKHVKWLANKRGMKTVVLHSFAHLGGDNAAPAFSRAFMAELEERLAGTGYAVATTPFGWFCAWTLDVYGESLAKVWKEI